MRLLLLFIILSSKIFAQNDLITIVGDSLKGMVIGGESIREVIGNVILTQGNVKVTCNKAIQYLARNDAELIGNVIVTQDTLTIRTERGFYFGNLRKTISNSGIQLDDKKVILSAKNGEYYFDENRAFFKDNVKLYDTISTLTSDALTYFRDKDKAIAVGLVKIEDKENIIYSDSLEHFRREQKTFAYNNVVIRNLNNNITVLGNYLEDDRIKKYTLIKDSPILIQIDTIITKNNDSTVTSYDTLFIISQEMEIFREGENKFVAKDSVKILRGLFSSLNEITIYLRDSSKIISYKKPDLEKQPVVWYEYSQLTGDSITIYLIDNKISQLDVDGKAFMLTQNENYQARFDQSTSSSAKIYFNDNKVNKVEYFGNVFSIYYMFDNEKPNGLVKANSKEATIYFSENEVSDVKLIGNPGTEYYPENLVENNESNFLLPRFNLIQNRPTKELMYSKLNKFKWRTH
ncbi:MAG: LPS export ABC transporter periplasmic protein LptC [Ignavibacterium sp.]|nr:LPS export ABC transporter periplasmic protein LptC [Ignavibacterium sp.]MDW8374061.1 OstA-like protein [Ignavibacteriales bacterium]